jgi:hypothetical protein
MEIEVLFHTMDVTPVKILHREHIYHSSSSCLHRHRHRRH